VQGERKRNRTGRCQSDETDSAPVVFPVGGRRTYKGRTEAYSKYLPFVLIGRLLLLTESQRVLANDSGAIN
jgi:hypothetical protein